MVQLSTVMQKTQRIQTDCHPAQGIELVPTTKLQSRKQHLVLYLKETNCRRRFIKR